jgi:hypothetical protein
MICVFVGDPGGGGEHNQGGGVGRMSAGDLGGGETWGDFKSKGEG